MVIESMSTSAPTSRKGYYTTADTPQPHDPVHGAALDVLKQCSIIAAVHSAEKFSAALASPTRAIYLLTGTPLTLPQMLSRARDAGKVCIVNIDFIEGLSRDRHAVEFLASTFRVDGVVSTRLESLKAAAGFGLITVQRTFAIDTAAVTAAQKCLAQFVPDAMEILPAMAAPKVGQKLHVTHPGLMMIGGGLIENVKEIEALIAAGVHSVSVSDERLWLI